ncbi:MAG: hypothetical protein IIC04_11645 [Proteobacteria bacterium]|nr:hypothetical protein [Pseudomonadota bacterium]
MIRFAATVMIFGVVPAAAGDGYVPPFPTVVRPGLEINTQNRAKARVHKCEDEGLRDLEGLESAFEEFWAYIPGACWWIELGILEEIRGHIRRDRYGRCRPPITISGIRKEDVNALIEDHESLILYHPHPPNASIVEYAIAKSGKMGFPDTCIEQARTETLESALPGIPDLMSMIGFSRTFHGRWRQGRFSEKIVSAYGVTEYRLSGRGKDGLEDQGWASTIRRQVAVYVKARTGLGERDYKALPSQKENARKINELIEFLNPKNGLFVITFAPFE